MKGASTMRRILCIVLLAGALLACTPAAPVPSQSLAVANTQNTGNPSVKVWVNTSSGVYHCPGTRWYGNTKRGAYMTQKEAQEKGFRPAYNRVCASGEQSATPPASHQTQGDTQTRQSQQGEGNRDV